MILQRFERRTYPYQRHTLPIKLKNLYSVDDAHAHVISSYLHANKKYHYKILTMLQLLE